MYEGKRRAVYVDPGKPVTEMTDEEIHAMARDLYCGIQAQRREQEPPVPMDEAEFERHVVAFMATGMDRVEAEEAAAISTGESGGCLSGDPEPG